jgi:hypothetical protein
VIAPPWNKLEIRIDNSAAIPSWIGLPRRLSISSNLVVV